MSPSAPTVIAPVTRYPCQSSPTQRKLTTVARLRAVSTTRRRCGGPGERQAALATHVGFCPSPFRTGSRPPRRPGFAALVPTRRWVFTMSRELIIKDTHRALWYEDGVLVRVLEAGRYAVPRALDVGFWRRKKIEVVL